MTEIINPKRELLNGVVKLRSGQVMFLTVVVLGAVITSVTLIAGLLMSFQIRRSADVAASARAIFAADAGVECMLYHIFNKGEMGAAAETNCNTNEVKEKFTNNASFNISIVEGGQIGVSSFRSTGSFNDAVRTVEINLTRIQ